ncbi:MAG: hypothetical protein NC114_12235 [Ruminococcus flavefaciens]|nr:hypothetical protein [Ruminococcus flavefaciens]
MEVIMGDKELQQLQMKRDINTIQGTAMIFGVVAAAQKAIDITPLNSFDEVCALADKLNALLSMIERNQNEGDEIKDKLFQLTKFESSEGDE